MSKRIVSEHERQLIEKAKKFLPNGTLGNLENQMVIHRSEGGRIWDASGNEYVDWLLGSGPMFIGHAHPEVTQAVLDQVKQGTTFFANNEHAILLAEEIVKAVPCAEQVRFLSTGSEATTYAVRAARAFRKKDTIAKCEGGYHGMADWALMSMAPENPQDFPLPTPDSAGIPLSVQRDVLIIPFNDIEKTEEIITKYHDELACVIVEPFQRLIPPKKGFLEGLREITKHYGIPLIFDEIVTGFRFSYGGAQEYYGVTPDLCTLGKIIGGGYPLSALAGREDIMHHMDSASKESDGFMPQIGTLSGNPVAAVAGLVTLEILRRDGTYERLFKTGQTLKDELARLLAEAEIPAQVVGDAPLFDVFFTENEVTDYRSSQKADKKLLRRFNELLLERGVFKGDTKFYVSTAHTKEDVDHTVGAFASAIAELNS